MSPEKHGSAMSYENFIKRAYKSLRGKKNGADSSFMEILINHEAGTARAGNHDQQLTKVKGYIAKALDKFLTFKLEEDERSGLLQLKEDLEPAYSSEELTRIVRQGLALTQRFKEYIPA